MKQRARRNQQHEPERPQTGQLAARGHHEGDGGQVLNDEDADADAAVERRGVVALLQQLHREDRAGEAQREPQQSSGLQREPGQRIQSGVRRSQQRCAAEGRGEHHVHQADAPDLRANDAAQVELEANDEEQQHDAQVRQLLQRVVGPKAQQLQSKASCQKAKQWGLPQAFREDPEDKRNANPEQLHREPFCPISASSQTLGIPCELGEGSVRGLR